MADEQSGRPLRRWRPFYAAFGAIDDAMEAAGHPRAEFRDVRVQIVKMLRGTEDDGVGEQLCAALDDAMAKSLETLQVVPVPRNKLASTDLARAVGALRNHGSARIRGLAGDVVRRLSAPIDGGVTTAVKVELDNDKISGDQVPRHGISIAPAATAEVHKKKLLIPPQKMLPAAVAAVAEMHKKKPPIPAAKIFPTDPVTEALKKVYVPPAKMVPTVVATLPTPSTSETKKPAVAESKKMEATKRKLHEGYEEAKRIKRQHIIQKIDDKDAAKLFVQKQQKMRPIVRGRVPAACRTSSAVRRSRLPSLQMI